MKLDDMIEAAYEVTSDDVRFSPDSLSRFIADCEEAEKDPDVFVDFGGRRYRPPFRCLCCGVEVSLAQFCYGRMCGSCDCGACSPLNRAYNPKVRHARLPRDFYLTISESAPAEVDATANVAS